MPETTLAEVRASDQRLAAITNLEDARLNMSYARGLVVAANREYKAAQTIDDAKTEREDAYETALEAGVYRLKSEAVLGLLIQQEQEAGRLADQGRPGDKPDNGVRFLKDYGLTWKESSRAQVVTEYQHLIADVAQQARRQHDLPTRKAFDRLVATTRPPQNANIEPSMTDLEGNRILDGDYTRLYKALVDDSVDLFLTDPPYDAESVSCYEGLAHLAAVKLKPGGLCIAYSGQSHLPEVLKAMGLHLNYWWVFALLAGGAELRFWSRHVWVRWKPLVAFIKPGNRLTPTWITDVIDGSGDDKRYHPWGQSVQEATTLIEALTPPNGLVVDPFCGGGTIPVACKLTRRQWCATELDDQTAAEASTRVVNTEVPDDSD